jgi:hypothetical protein
MADITCTSKSSALEALTAIAATMKKGTPRDALTSIAVWINECVPNVMMPEEVQERLKKIFEGSEEQQKGRAWVETEESDPAYVPGENVKGVSWKHHKMINEPEHGAELPCYWDSNSKAWVPVSKRPRP